MSITKNVDSILASGEVAEEILRGEIERRIEECRIKLEKDISVCKEAIGKANNDGWIQIKNKNLYYTSRVPNRNVLMVNTTTVEDNSIYSSNDIEKIINYEGFEMRWITEKEIMLFQGVERGKNPLVGPYDGYYRYFYRKGYYYDYVNYRNNSNWNYYNVYNNSNYSGIGSSNSNLPIFSKEKKNAKVFFFLVNQLIPVGVSETEEQCFNNLFQLAKEGKINITEKLVEIAPKYLEEIKNYKVKNFYNVSFERDHLIKAVELPNSPLTEEDCIKIAKSYLDCDKNRAAIESYDEGQIFEINRGHWELWKEANKDKNTKDEEKTKTQKQQFQVKLVKPFVARNPVADVNRKGVVGIDFGTKSTVVVLLNDNSKIQQMRIGSGNLKKEVKKTDYENPTVMEFIDIKDFMNRYQAAKGRPKTLWKDITISHTAVDGLQNSKDSQYYYSYFSDLKQWTDDKERKIRIKDQKKYEVVLQDFLEIEDNTFNPIEIYAYYLGLAINNMRNGIYMDYILSYPVNYPVKVRNKIIKCFENGIYKSFPEEVQNDKECKELFRVRAGVSEPAAYAICALKGYGFKPEEGEKYLYGIFDFGGGTTDFDFGIWRGAEEKESRRVDYVIEHFGAGGDRYLGGENLLELLTFDVFKKNQKIMLEKELSFFKPKECSDFPGSEMLLNSSQEARLNTKNLMEKLRYFWEFGGLQKKEQGKTEKSTATEKSTEKTEINSEQKAVLQAIKEGIIKISLFDKKGNIQSNVELKINAADLEKILTDRIRVGVVNFFEAIKNVFAKEQVKDITKIHIFLAGNSSKSPIVHKIFKQIIEKKTKEIIDYWKEQKKTIKEENDIFEVFPALGSEEAEKKLEAMGITSKEELKEYEKPTGKTGVAYGLIEGRNASRIKVVSEIESTDEAKFKYYIGYEKKGKFHVEIERDIAYKKWVEFIDATDTDFELFYSSLPEAITNQMEITRVKRMPCRIKQTYDNDVNIYLRAVEPEVLEYAVGKGDAIVNDKFLEGPYKVKLEE